MSIPLYPNPVLTEMMAGSRSNLENERAEREDWRKGTAKTMQRSQSALAESKITLMVADQVLSRNRGFISS